MCYIIYCGYKLEHIFNYCYNALQGCYFDVPLDHSVTELWPAFGALGAKLAFLDGLNVPDQGIRLVICSAKSLY